MHIPSTARRSGEAGPRRPPVRRRAGTRAAIIGVIVLLLLTVATTLTPPPKVRPNAPLVLTPEGNATWPTPIRHVFVIVLENSEADHTLASAPFQLHLAQKYSYASNYYGVCHPSDPNYLALTSGDGWNCGSNNFHFYNTSNIGDLAASAGRSWAGFFETMPIDCDIHGYSTYTQTPNSFVHYWDIWNNSLKCAAHDLPLAAFYADALLGALPNYALIIPNLTNSGHNSNVTVADQWLKSFLSPLLNDSFFQSSVFFVTYDEGLSAKGYTSHSVSVYGGNIYLAAVSPFTRGVHPYPTNPYTANGSHYSLLTTIEWLLGTGHTGHYDNASIFPPMKGLFNFSLAHHLTMAVSASTTVGHAPLTVGFSASIAGGTAPYNYSWSFGDGATSESAGPEHTYSAAGRYLVTLDVSDSQGLNGTAHTNVTVVPRTPPLVATLNLSPVSGSAPLMISYSGSAKGGSPPYAYEWSFGDGSTSSSVSGSHTFDSTGRYPVLLTVTDENGSTAQADRSVSVGVTASNLSIQTNVAPRNGTAPLTVLFDLNASGGASPYTYNWSFGDGSSTSLASPLHTYMAPGAFTARWTVSDAQGAELSSATTIVVAAPTLLATLWSNNSLGPTPDAVDFEANATGGVAPYAFAWSFSDGATEGNVADVAHTFVALGTSAALLTVRDSFGDTVTLRQNVSVFTPLGIVASSSPSAIYLGQSVEFSAVSSGGLAPFAFNWTVAGDPVGMPGPVSSWSPNATGRYQLNVTVTDAAGESVTATTNLSVSAPGSTGPGGSNLPAPSTAVLALLVAAAAAATIGSVVVLERRRARRPRRPF